MASKITPFYHVFHDRNGNALENGHIYIGSANTNPQVSDNQINIYWDESLTIPAAQPIRTINGFPSRSGSPAAFYVSEAEFSLVIRDKNESLVYSEPVAFDNSTRLRNDLASTDTDDETKGFHLVYHPPVSGESGLVTDYEYEIGVAKRYGIIADADAVYSGGGWNYTAGTDQGAKINALLAAGILDITLPAGNIYITTPIVPVSGMVLRSEYENYNAPGTKVTPITRLIFNGSSTESCIVVDSAAAEVSHMLIKGIRISDAREDISGVIPTSGWGIATENAVNRTHLKDLFIDQFPDGPVQVGNSDNSKAGDNIIVDNVWCIPSRYHLDYDAETGGFTVGLTITGGTSGHTAVIAAIEDNGTTGRLILTSPSGKFQDNETITDTSTGSATTNGILKANGVSIGNFNNICSISNIYCDGEGNAITRTTGNSISGVILINNVKHESGDAIFSTVQTASNDRVIAFNVIRRDSQSVPVIGPVSSRGAYFSIAHSKADGSGSQSPVFWDSNDAVVTTGESYVASTGPMTIYGADNQDNIVLDFTSSGDPKLILTRNNSARVEIYTTATVSKLNYALASSHILEIENTSNTSSSGVKIKSAAGGGGFILELDRTVSDGRYLIFSRNGTAEIYIISGAGTPEGVYSAPPGSMYYNYTIASGEYAMYIKRTGTGNTGWEGQGTVLP